MKTYWRYFIHYFLITFSLFLALKILSIFDKELRFDALYMLIGMGAILIFSFLMALFASQYMAGIRKMVFATNDERICSELENIILTKTPKKVKEEGKDEYGNDKNVYTQKNWYTKWLTNPIVLVKKEDRLVLEIPEGYYKLFRESYERYL